MDVDSLETPEHGGSSTFSSSRILWGEVSAQRGLSTAVEGTGTVACGPWEALSRTGQGVRRVHPGLVVRVGTVPCVSTRTLLKSHTAGQSLPYPQEPSCSLGGLPGKSLFWDVNHA